MLNHLLIVAEELAGEYPKKIGIGEAAIDALLGFLVVFVGIALLVGIVWLVGFLMRKFPVTNKKPKKAEAERKSEVAEKAPSTESEELSEETVAVITAAIMAYYEKENPKCEFKVKRIKKI